MLTAKNRSALLPLFAVLFLLLSGPLVAQPMLTFPRQSPAAIQRNFNTLNTKSRLLTAQGKTDEAEALMDEALETANEQQLNLYGYQLMNQGNLEKAHEIFVLNTERYPESWNVWDSLGECLANMGETEEAIDNYEKALEMVSAMENPPPGDQPGRINGVLDKLKAQ